DAYFLSLLFFFQAEDGIRDFSRDWSSDVCSSDLVERRVVDGARSVGMTGRQVLFKAEVPLGLPLLIGGLRSATLQVVATVTLARSEERRVGKGRWARVSWYRLLSKIETRRLGESR